MKIKLSKSQWEAMGKKAGWMKIAVVGEETLENIPPRAKYHTPTESMLVLLETDEQWSVNVVNKVKKGMENNDLWAIIRALERFFEAREYNAHGLKYHFEQLKQLSKGSNENNII